MDTSSVHVSHLYLYLCLLTHIYAYHYHRETTVSKYSNLRISSLEQVDIEACDFLFCPPFQRQCNEMLPFIYFNPILIEEARSIAIMSPSA